MEDTQFYADHLKSNSDPTHRETTNNDPIPLQELQVTPEAKDEQTQETSQEAPRFNKNQIKCNPNCEMNNQSCNHHIDLKQPINRPNPGEGSAKDLKIGDIFTNLKIQESRVKCNFPDDGHEHWKYSWNVHYVLTNHMRELVIAENEWVSPSFLRHRGMHSCLWHRVRSSESRQQTLTQYVFAPVLRSNANTSKPGGCTPSLNGICR